MTLPLTVIGGFLGAGKTTLLKHLLENANGRRLAVLINDFGALNIDASLIKATGADSIELSNGCVCCSLGDDLVEQLVLLEKSAERFDHVVIEASGVGDPWKIAQIGMVAGAYRLDSVIVVVDIATIAEHLTDDLVSDVVLRQVARADLIAANKADTTSLRQIQKAKEKLSPYILNNHCAWINTIEANLDINLALGNVSSGLPNQRAMHFRRDIRMTLSHQRFQTMSFTNTRCFDEASLREFFSTLAPQPWQSLLRGKAILRTSSGWLEWHKVGTRQTWKEHKTRLDQNLFLQNPSELVLISSSIDEVISTAFVSKGWVLLK
jgi:G3E family GTPase